MLLLSANLSAIFFVTVFQCTSQSFLISRDISKFTKISRAPAAATDIWGVLKYHEPVLIPDTPKKPCYFLFILQGKEISHFT